MFAVVFTVIGVVVWLSGGSFPTWLAVAGLFFLVAALLSPKLLLPLNRLWEQLGHRLGTVGNWVILGLFYYVVVTPSGLIMRLIGSDPMERRRKPDGSSYFAAVRRQASRETLSDMF